MFSVESDVLATDAVESGQIAKSYKIFLNAHRVFVSEHLGATIFFVAESVVKLFKLFKEEVAKGNHGVNDRGINFLYDISPSCFVPCRADTFIDEAGNTVLIFTLEKDENENELRNIIKAAWEREDKNAK